MGTVSKFGPDMVALPDPGEIESHALAFARMMFAHAAFEREVRELQSNIANEHGFGERKANQWRTPDCAKRMVALIEKKLGKGLPETGPIEKLLTDAVESCGQRNLLAHGTWSCFDRRTLSIQVRGGVRWDGDEFAPPMSYYTVAHIDALTEQFKDIAAELYKLRRSLCPPSTEDDLRG